MRFYWKGMSEDIREFCQGCVLCQIFKNTNTEKQKIGTPRVVSEPLKYWQIDVVSGLTSVNGKKSFLTMIEMFTGFAIPVALTSETSEAIAKAVDENLIKVFGAPVEISSDNAANLTGPAMKKLMEFHGIRYRTTVPYSPESHALVENCNRFITELIRIFSDQFQCQWTSVLTIATLVYNSVPRKSLKWHSPYYLLFQTEPFGGGEGFDASNLDIEEYLKRTVNDRNFVRLTREFLLREREKRNRARNLKYRSYPKDTLILVRDKRPRIHKKLKPIFFKLPQKVVTEYASTVYAEDIFGRVRKHSKNNIRLASPRSVELFGSIPPKFKMIMGDEFNSERFEEIKDTGVIPEYLNDISLQQELGEMTRRGDLPLDTHLLEHSQPELVEHEVRAQEDSEEIEDEDELEEILNDRMIEKLKLLHDEHLLTDSKLELKEVTRLYNETISDPPSQRRDRQETEIENEMREIQISDNAAVNPANILPEGTTRRRRVRFNIPNLN
jgi:hypothetical protein